MWVANDQGYFRQNGLDVHMVAANAGTNSLAGLISGQVQFVHIVVDKAITADFGGANLVTVAMPIDAALMYLYGSKSVASVADLKGKVVADTGAGSATNIAAEILLERAGLHPGQDVSLQHVGGIPGEIAALKAGQVQAAVLDPPFTLMAQQLGDHEVASLPAIHYDYPIGWVVVRNDWADAHAPVVEGYIHALAQAIAFIHQDPSASQRILSKYTKVTDPGLLKAAYDANAPYYPSDLTPDMAAIRNVLSYLAQHGVAQAKTADPGSFVDDRFVQAVQARG
jgi:NitT/TauT family transport system substrate-binding protein